MIRRAQGSAEPRVGGGNTLLPQRRRVRCRYTRPPQLKQLPACLLLFASSTTTSCTIHERPGDFDAFAVLPHLKRGWAMPLFTKEQA
jgi:hypothetical protein